MSTIKDAVEDVLNNRRLSAQEAVDRRFGPTVRQHVNGRPVARAEFVARMADVRETIEHVSITVLDELSDGDRYAERHVIALVQRDGTRIRQEVFVLAQRDPDGRFLRMNETSRTLADG